MTDHTAIVERMAVQLAKDAGEPDWPSLCERDKRYWRARAQAALTASGLLEVLEKAEAVADEAVDLAGAWYPKKMIDYEPWDALRNAIKGVRE